MDKTRTFEIESYDGKQVREVTIDRRWLNVEADLGLSGATVAAYIGRCVDVRAYLVQQHELAEASYRVWKARKKAAELASDPKLAQWKLEIRYRKHKEYMNFNTRLAELQGQMTWIEGIQKALEIKAHTINAFVKGDHGAEMATAAAGLTSKTKRKRGSVKPRTSAANRKLD